MGMIQCPDCKSNVSDSVSVCPKCGRQFTEEDKKHKPTSILRMALGVLVVVIVASYIFGGDNSSGPSKDEMPKQIIGAGALFGEFSANEVAAKQKYDGKYVAVAGRVGRISSSIAGYPEVHFFMDEFGMQSVMCQFPKKEADKIASLRPGQRIVAIGKVGVFVLGLQLSIDKCQLYERPQQ